MPLASIAVGMTLIAETLEAVGNESSSIRLKYSLATLPTVVQLPLSSSWTV